MWWLDQVSDSYWVSSLPSVGYLTIVSKVVYNNRLKFIIGKRGSRKKSSLYVSMNLKRLFVFVCQRLVMRILILFGSGSWPTGRMSSLSYWLAHCGWLSTGYSSIHILSNGILVFGSSYFMSWVF